MAMAMLYMYLQFLLNHNTNNNSSKFHFFFVLCFSSSSFFPLSSCFASCTAGCNAIALYIAASTDILSDIANRFDSDSWSSIQTLNNITDVTSVHVGELILIPFDCKCENGTLGHTFTYTTTQTDELETISEILYGNLSSSALIQSANPDEDFLDLQENENLSIPINCSCGDPSVSDKYGLFGTYSAQLDDTLSSISSQFNVSSDLIQSYNPSVSFNPLEVHSILFIPSKDSTGQYPPYNISSAGSSAGNKSERKIILKAVIGGACFILSILGLGIFAYRRNARSSKNGYDQYKEENKLIDIEKSESIQNTFNSSSRKLGDLMDEHCICFSHNDLAALADNFSVANQIGQGGFATVYYGERNGQKLAIKKMARTNEKEFINELRVLSTAHHANLVGLVGYCMELDFLFLVYEYIENGTLADHLRSRTDPMSWDRRVRIALDTARGVEYMHDHAWRTYIHRDLKPSNILLDKNYHAKVGDFGLTSLMHPGGNGTAKTMGLMGTRGYLPPEFAQFGKFSIKQDVYAFGVILFQMVSGKEAITEHPEEDTDEKIQLVLLFREVLQEANAVEKIKSLVDPALDTDYPVEAVWKVIQLAEVCTDDNPDMRPQMRDVVVELNMLLHGSYETKFHS